jgi:hypothetical protein
VAPQNPEQLPDLAFLYERVAQGELRDDLVAVSPTLSLAEHVALLDQFGEDSVRGAFGDTHRGGDVAQSGARVLSHAQEHMCVVGQKVPGRIGARSG